MSPHIRTQVQDKSRKTSHPNLHLDRNPVLFLSKAELNFWVHICTELPGAQSIKAQLHLNKPGLVGGGGAPCAHFADGEMEVWSTAAFSFRIMSLS